MEKTEKTMISDTDRQTILNDLTAETFKYIDMANRIYGKNYSYPMVTINLHGRVAGMAYSASRHIKYNVELYLRNKADFLARTVPHEVAHLIADWNSITVSYRRIKPHGREWRMVMVRFGVKDITRCHSYDTNALVMGKTQARPFVYSCGCKEFHLTRNIHNKILMGQERKCLKCKNPIKLVRTEMINRQEKAKELLTLAKEYDTVST
jgi:SprT protein